MQYDVIAFQAAPAAGIAIARLHEIDVAHAIARRPVLHGGVELEPVGVVAGAAGQEEEVDGTWTPYHPVGCSACNNGYKGRVGIYQVMPISEAVQRIILSEGTAMDIAAQAAKDGVRDLRQSGLVKVRAGVTTLEEVIAVTNE